MGYRAISLKLPTDYSDEMLRERIGKALSLSEFSYTIEQQSLDACRKSDIHWLVRVGVTSQQVEGGAPETPAPLSIPRVAPGRKAVVVGSGPAGFFAALVLQKAGVHVTVIERGSDVDTRAEGIRTFEKTGAFNPSCSYAFGEGGAGTFSDGKLTSRSKHIGSERQFILASYIRAGAPEEIAYMAHPHLGSDNLRRIVKRLREEFMALGGRMLFDTMLEDLTIERGRVVEAVTSSGGIEADCFLIAPGHSAYETYRMLIGKGVPFRTKNFAIGSRVEHPQELINLAQWGRTSLPGVKAAEYRLTFNAQGHLPVYTFCMCPGGAVIPATAYADTNIVNGMSYYRRAGRFANAACVAAVNLESLLDRAISPTEALDWLGSLEHSFYEYSSSFAAPACRITDFVTRRGPSDVLESSYPLGLKPAPLWEMLPSQISNAIAEGLKDFARKIKGFETGAILGLESKTSSPIQAVRDKTGLCAGFENLYLVGEGSGYAGGIISSAADGIKAALHVAERFARL
ncbi:MAG TPA: FAD-dependent monooxygenase [Sedimentisphaerales bacterium]|nr:FAD-dependent monooxygenase [Sedimentisphaerales bacterium]HRS09431.1 FAD-dependent monooxygenase [Sedimentisphaerales bacterium]HRV46128.1 FAD-dependent monooxygenase [Sedimentisphaerales bacterium]